MSGQELLVLVGGTALIIFILWFFLGKKDTGEAKVSAGDGDKIQETTIVVEGAYSPNEILVKKGLPVRITFDRRESGDCSEWVIFGNSRWRVAGGKIEKEIKARLEPFAKTKVEFTPMKAGEFPFTCGMGMLHGKMIVKE
ncbi:cupredoxin domain-containing protein [Candidatus Microgenomates bacterium]|nr:cupredoxin domain-containing protein [Candidatus Microgenomates bacterium]